MNSKYHAEILAGMIKEAWAVTATTEQILVTQGIKFGREHGHRFTRLNPSNDGACYVYCDAFGTNYYYGTTRHDAPCWETQWDVTVDRSVVVDFVVNLLLDKD